MQKIFILFLFILSFQFSKAQTKVDGSSAKPIEINFSDTTKPDFNPTLISLDKQPIPASEYGDKKDILYKKRMALRNLKGAEIKKKASKQTKLYQI